MQKAKATLEKRFLNKIGFWREIWYHTLLYEITLERTKEIQETFGLNAFLGNYKPGLQYARATVFPSNDR